VVIRPNAGTGDSDRVEIIWTDAAIANTWLQVQVLATDDTGLETPDVFYWGSKLGDAGFPVTTHFSTTVAADAARILSAMGPAGGITNILDFNRDNMVTASGDRPVVIANLGAIVRINIGADGPFASVGDGDADEFLAAGMGDSGIASALAASRTPATFAHALPVNSMHRLDRANSPRRQVIAYFEQLALADRREPYVPEAGADDLEELLDCLVADVAVR
jgi:hypothetical protein